MSGKGASSTRNLAYTAMFAVLIAAGAFIKIPFVPAPFTLQTFFCMLAGACLGAKRGVAAAAVYIALGLVGLPVFTAGGGFQYVSHVTFGYLLGLLPAALLGGLTLHRGAGKNNFFLLLCLFFACGVIVLVCGALYYAFVLGGLSGGNAYAVFKSFCLLYLPAELLKAVVCAAIYPRLSRVI